MDLALLVSSLSRQDGTTRHSQQEALYRSLRNMLLDGHIPPGTRLVSTRVLAAELGIARNSAVYAYERLAEEGFVAATRNGTITRWDGCGRSTSPNAARPRFDCPSACMGWRTPIPNPNACCRSFPASLDEFPVAQWRRCIERAWRVIQPAQLAYGPVEGLPELRRAVAAYIRVSRGVRCETGQVFITDGTQSSLELCARMLANPGEYGWLENPCYNGARTAFRSTGLGSCRSRSTTKAWRQTTNNGAPGRPADLYDTVAPVPARRADGPVGARRSSSARACGAWIIEDDYDSEFRHGGQPLPAIQGLDADAPVCYLGTFSKTMFPALRLGFMVVPPTLVDRFTRTLRELVHRGHSADQLAMAEFIDTGLFARHLRRMRTLYAERRSSLEAALARHLGAVLGIRESAGGMHLSANLAMPLHDTDVARAAAAHGLLLQPLSSYRVGDGRSYNGFVLGYSGLNDATIEAATRQLAAIIEQHGRTRG